MRSTLSLATSSSCLMRPAFAEPLSDSVCRRARLSAPERRSNVPCRHTSRHPVRIPCGSACAERGVATGAMAGRVFLVLKNDQKVK